MTLRTVTLLALAALAFPAGADVARAQETCIECHGEHYRARLSAPARAEPRSIHGQNDVFCSGCHGGRPDVPNASAHDASAGFIAKPPPAEVARVCLHCHEEDSANAYPQSHHGEAVAAGSTRAPTCVDCHGAHSIGVPGGTGVAMDPVSTCGSCHSSPETMAGTELPTDQETQYRESVHGRAWAGGSEDAPTCIACHDPHAFKSAGEAVNACGRCHEALRQAFDSGPHSAAFARLGFPDCAACHGSHEIRRADLSLLEEGHLGACQRCHAEGQPFFDRVARIARAVAEAEAPGFVPADREALRLAIHALDVDEVERLAATRVAATTEDTIVEREGVGLRFAMAGGAFLLVLVGGVAFLRWRKRGEP